MDFELVSEFTDVETIATGGSIVSSHGGSGLAPCCWLLR
jgi:hypothetical protein